jgi:hypothetical protein
LKPIPKIPKFPISVCNGKIEIRVGYPPPLLFQPEPIEQYLSPDFVSRLAAILSDGDYDAAVSNAIAIIEGCARELSLRKSPVSEITLSRNSSPNSVRKTAFWRHCSLDPVIEVAAKIGRSVSPDDAVQRAFSIIEKAMTTLERRAEVNVGAQWKNLATTPCTQLSSRHLGSDLSEYLKPHWPWNQAAKHITRAKRPDRAAKRFLSFLKDVLSSNSSRTELESAIADREKNGFALSEVYELQKFYADWHKGYIKGKQSQSGKKFGKKNLSKNSA